MIGLENFSLLPKLSSFRQSSSFKMLKINIIAITVCKNETKLNNEMKRGCVDKFPQVWYFDKSRIIHRSVFSFCPLNKSPKKRRFLEEKKQKRS